MTIIRMYRFYTDEPSKVDYRPSATIELKIVENNDKSFISLWLDDEHNILHAKENYEHQMYTRGAIGNLQIRFDNYFDILKKVYPIVVESFTTEKQL